MRISVILATYNQPEWLEKVLWGYAVQTVRPFEVVVADDGSDDRTTAMIEKLRGDTGLKIEHVWHEDRGFRKCRILNRATLRAEADYLLYSDGDCIPRRDFVEVHARMARYRHFLSGGLVRLPMDLSRRITVDDVASGRAVELSWLRKHGLAFNKKCLLMPPAATLGTTLGATLDAVTTTRPSWNGHNASGWKADVVRVGGFDERMGYGGEDQELGLRLLAAGIRAKQIRHRAVCVHLDHARGYVDEAVLRWNQRHRRRILAEGTSYTEHGIALLAEEEQRPATLKLFVASDVPLCRAA